MRSSLLVLCAGALSAIAFGEVTLRGNDPSAKHVDAGVDCTDSAFATMPECQDGIPAASGTAKAAEEGASGIAEAASAAEEGASGTAEAAQEGASGTAEAAKEGASGTAEAAEEAAELKVDCTDAASATTPECNSMNDDADDMTGDDMTEDEVTSPVMLAETEEMIPADDEVTSLLETKVLASKPKYIHPSICYSSTMWKRLCGIYRGQKWICYSKHHDFSKWNRYKHNNGRVMHDRRAPAHLRARARHNYGYYKTRVGLYRRYCAQKYAKVRNGWMRFGRGRWRNVRQDTWNQNRWRKGIGW